MRRVATIVAAGAAMGLAGVAMGQGIDFGSATVVNGAATVNGSLATDVFGDEVMIFSAIDQFRAANTANHYMVNATAGSTFRAETSAPTNGLTSLDTRLRVRRSDTSVIGENDDTSGLGLFSRVTGTVPGDGVLDMHVSHWSDSAYDGTGSGASTEGYYDLTVYEVELLSAGINGQWWAFTGLTPGGNFSAETIAASFTGAQFFPDDTVIAAWDSSGMLLGRDDDGGGGQGLSLLEGVVPADGIVYISVASYHGFSGLDTQEYYSSGNVVDGTFTLQFIPTPGSLALLGLGGLVAVRRRR